MVEGTKIAHNLDDKELRVGKRVQLRKELWLFVCTFVVMKQFAMHPRRPTHAHMSLLF